MDNWENILIKSNTSIFDVMSIIDCEGSQMAVVVDDEKKILGVVTDGDIRRGIFVVVRYGEHVLCQGRLQFVW